MLADLAVEHGLGTRVRAFLLQCEERQRRSGYAALFETLSEQIQADLVEHVYARSLSSVTYFRARSVEFRLDVFKALGVAVYAPSERLVRPATLHLIVNHGGFVAKDGRIYVKGCSFDHDFLLESWRAETHQPGVALTFCHV